MKKIEWTNKTLNPVTGCSPISEGCQNCYARGIAYRFAGRNGYSKDNPFKVTLHPERLDKISKTGHSMIFLNSMSDLFHPDIPTQYLDKIIRAVEDNPQHIFQVLTKRAEYLEDYFCGLGRIPNNLWLGVTTETQERLDERLPLLLDIPAKVRFISVEPILSKITLRNYTPDWVIIGAETGMKKRVALKKWFFYLRDECLEKKIPLLIKGDSYYVPGLKYNQIPKGY